MLEIKNRNVSDYQHNYGRTQMVVLGNTSTPWVRVDLGVPQGSVVGPLLYYILFTAHIPSVLAKHQVEGHLYADDVQALVQGSPSQQISLVETIGSLNIARSPLLDDSKQT